MSRSLPASLSLVVLVGAFAACSDDNGTTEPILPGEASNVQVVVRFDSATVTWTAGTNADAHVVTLTQTAAPQSPIAMAPAQQQIGVDTVPSGTNQTGFGSLTSGATYEASVLAINSTGSAPSSPTGSGDVAADMVVVRGTISSNTTWVDDNTYVLQGPVFVGVDGGADADLTIEPGTTIIGDPEPPGSGERGSYLVITRGSRIIADANADRPAGQQDEPPHPDSVIVFTSAFPRGDRGRGDWGGLVINGSAPINSGDEAEGEGNSGLYGGQNANDDSGILRGVRVEFAGDRVTETDELNGIAFQGVGAGTLVDYVQVHYNLDDGTEPFGGAVTQTHMVMTGIGDDSFDGTDGYQGFMQFLIAQQRADNADNGFEISNNGDAPTASPHSSAVVANATMIGARLDLGSGEISGEGNTSDHAIAFREGSNFRVFNSIFTGFGKSGFCIEEDATATNANNRSTGSLDPTTTLRFEHNIMWNNVEVGVDTANYLGCDGFAPEDEEASYTATKAFADMFDNIVADPEFSDAAFDIGSMSSPPDLTLTAMPDGYTAFDVSTLNTAAGIVLPVDGRRLVATNYAGAIAPGTQLAAAWYNGWTVWANDGSDSRPNHEGN